jgi:2-haloacid dehalogenase
VTARRRPDWIAFDLNGTLLDPSAIVQPQDGLPEPERWGGEALDEAIRLSMADTLLGVYRPFPHHLAAALERRLAAGGHDRGPLEAMLERAARMPPFPEASAALERLGAAGLRLAVVTNSAADGARESLAAAELVDRFDAVIGSDLVRVYKPHPALYAAAIRELDASPDRLCLVTAHGWDAMGAAAAGWMTAWVVRRERHLPAAVARPDVVGVDLLDVAGRLARLAAPGRDG